MRTTARQAATAAAWVAAGALGATVLTGVASAGSFGPISGVLHRAVAATSSDSSSPAAATAHRGMMRDVLHGSLTVATADGTAVVDVQRGEVTAASSTSLTVRSTDGFSATYALTGTTLVRRDGSTATGADLAVGDTAMVRASDGTAQVVRALSPAAAAELKDRLANGTAGMGGMRSGLGGMGLGGPGTGGMGGMGAGMGLDADDA